ncbi:MAG: hypothetical protein HYR74_10465 [Candidatus Eisenbacteria bacterium]|nr:hypothetical protein [Candidatus Eisenbacteria bacterium]
MNADRDLDVRLAVYRRLIATAAAPTAGEVAAELGATAADVREAYARLAQRRLLVLMPDGETIRMAPPFSGVPTQHRVIVGATEYAAPCAWDAFGIVAVLGGRGVVRSRCEQSHAPLELRIEDGVGADSQWRYHAAVPARRWWDDIVYT